MDKIFIKDFEIFAKHGVLKEEKSLGQKFVLSLELTLDLRAAGLRDDLEKTVNYAQLCYDVEKEFTKQSYDLIETAAEKTAEFILLSYPQIQNVRVTLKKPWAPIGRPLKYAAVEIQRGYHKVYIALGSNLGDKNENLNSALKLIDENKLCTVTRVSSFYETKPVGYTEQDNFLNAAAEIKTLMTPLEFMDFLLSIENQLKRERKIHWGPRTIDLDILLYDELISEDEHAVIPHPRMEKRLFVITPLCDIAPYKLHPILKKRFIDIKNELEATEEL